MNRKLYLIFLLFGLCNFAFAQQRTITGTVTDLKDGTRLPGVSVSVKGSSIGTQTDLNGAYKLTVPAGTKSLTFTYVGYKTAELTISGTVLNAQIEVNTKQLNEVVVVGYGTQKRSSITGSIASISSKEIEETPVTSFEQAIQGKAAGVSISAGNGKLGQAIAVNIRGSSSIYAGNQPLYVIDGNVINSGSLSSTSAPTDPLADINFNDIESIEILKDAQAAAIYGSRAGNGVILITTKKGKAGTARIDFTAQWGTSDPSRHRQFLNTSQWLQLERRAGQGAAEQDYAAGYYNTLADAQDDYNSYLNSKFTALAAGSSDITKYNTNWERQAFQKAPQQQYDLNLSGGSDKTTYFISGQALDQTGIIIGNHFKRFAGRVNVTSKMTSTFEIGANLSEAHTSNDRLGNDDLFDQPMQMVALSPITPVIDPRTGLISGTPPGLSSAYPLYYNPLISTNNAYYHASDYRTFGNVYANWEIVKHLTFRSEFGMDVTNSDEDSYYNSLTYRDTGTDHGFGENTAKFLGHYTLNNYFNYKNVFAKKHSLDVTAGSSYESQHYVTNDIQGEQFPSDAYKVISAAAVKSAGSSGMTDYALISYFARANYSFEDKYLLSASVRADGSSRFGTNNKYGWFPGVSAGWVLTQENFLKNVTYLSNLKLKASYGLTGNDQIGNYAYQGLFTGDASYNGAPGQRFSQIANPDLKWEKNRQTDVGLEFGFFNNRLSGGVDYYYKFTSNAIMYVNIPETTGISTQIQNLAKLYNRGIEFEVSGDILVGKFKWTASANAAYNKNKVTYTAGQVINDGADLNRVIEGQPIGVFYGPEYAGVDPANGDALYYLNTKNSDGSINRGKTNDYNAAQSVVLGNPTPSWTGGISTNASYKGFDLSVSFQGAFGNKIYNQAGQYMSAEASNGMDNQTVDQMNYWNKPGDITNIPEPRLFYANGTSPSSRYLSSGSYVRCKTVTLGYTLPKDITSKIGIKKARVFVNGYNLFVITKYNGWDPEVNTDYLASNINLGVDFYSAPQPRTVTFGVNIGL